MNKEKLDNELFKLNEMMRQLDSVWHHLYMLGVDREKCPITPTLEYLHERYMIVQKELHELTNNKKYETIIKR